ncbi:hypothetical protein BOO71_0000628 [Deinococcus marmoris]|uniref:Uncharacterized protein n=2 Tax=Deinococcus marmoris TaxID=249408 RepID=A0A1U7P4W8_9DEIO|nr:hypothetical protein BOO71_0000628 [Deinococcus marmoris]
MDVNSRTIEYRIAKRGLAPEKSGLIRLSLLAIEVGVTRQALRYRASKGDFKVTPWGHCPCVKPAEARKVRAMYAHPKQADYAGWLPSQAAADAIGASQARLFRLTTKHPDKLAGIRWVRAQGQGGFALLFCPADLPELNRRFGRRALPRRYAGLHTAPQFTDLIGVSDSRVFKWVKAGAPHREDLYGRYWFDLYAVRVWLASGVIRPRDLMAVLARMDAALPARAA